MPACRISSSARPLNVHSTLMAVVSKMLWSTPLLLLGASLAAAQSCPQVHVFGARETTAPPGYGTAGSVVTSIENAFPGSTAEVINYPACGGQSSCGGVSYANSVIEGVSAVASQVNSFNERCPDTVLVLVGYSQVCTVAQPHNQCRK